MAPVRSAWKSPPPPRTRTCPPSPQSTPATTQTVSLTGTIVTADGQLLAYSVIIDGFPEGGMWSARTAMDNDLIVPLSGCGCQG